MNKLKAACATFAIIFLKELRHSFRDKDVLIYTVIVPAVLYPLLMIGGIELFLMKQEAETKTQINYAVIDDKKPKIQKLEKILALSQHYKKINVASGRQDLFSGRVSFLLDEVPVPTHEWLTVNTPGETRVEALVPRNAVDNKIVDDLNEELRNNYKKALNKAFLDKGYGPAAVEINTVAQKNTNAQKKEMFSLGLVLVLFSLLNVALGAAYPAVAATSEEFERNTMEALLLLPVDRWFFLTAKLAAVVVLALVAGSLNLASMYGDSCLAIMGAPTVAGIDMFRPDFKLSPLQMPLVAFLYLVVAVLYAALTMTTAAFCRTVRSSQQWITLPLIIFMLIPFLTIVPQLELNNWTAAIPVLGSLLALKSLFDGDAPALPHFISIAQALIVVALSMKLAEILIFERFEGKWRS